MPEQATGNERQPRYIFALGEMLVYLGNLLERPADVGHRHLK